MKNGTNHFPVVRTLTMMMKFPSESSQSLSSPEAEGRGLAQSQLVSAGLGVSWPRLSRGRARLTRVRTPASDGSRGQCGDSCIIKHSQ